jgi:GR25 family glycosyltransferase involved in LPS biosynthesis
MPKNIFNSFFDKIYVISLYDNDKRWKEVQKQFKNRKIDVERFIAVDGRCKKGEIDCLEKLKTFELSYNVRIPVKKDVQLKKILPAASLTIGTILLLRAMVKNKWKRILICEDDIILNRNITEKFKQGVKELGTKRWDVLYLGCGGECGHKDVGWDKNKYISPWNENGGMDDTFYVKQRNDLRTPCEEEECIPISEHISKAVSAGGTWCYSYSLAGAKKVLKLIDDNANNHIDQLLIKLMKKDKIKAIAFDPPIAMHEDLRKGRITDIPW